jgi:hypothetical protein
VKLKKPLTNLNIFAIIFIEIANKFVGRKIVMVKKNIKIISYHYMNVNNKLEIPRMG